MFTTAAPKTLRTLCVFGALLLLLITSSFIIFAKSQQSRYLQNTDTNLHRSKQLRDNLTAVLSPAAIEAGQKDLSTDHLLRQLTTINKEPIGPIADSTLLTCASTLPALTCGSYRSSLQSTRTSFEHIYAEISYHQAVMTALQPLLEYNPEAELGDDRLNQPTIDSRIDAGRQGLAKVLASLNNIPATHDSSKDELTGTVQTLQSKLESFATTQDKSAWYQAVGTAQQITIDNRQSYWEEALTRHYDAIDSSMRKLSTYKKSVTR